MDMVSRRLNLTLPQQFDDLLEELASLSGRSKVSYVLDALKFSLPHWQRDLAHLKKGFRVVQAASGEVSEPPLVVDPPKPSAVVPEPFKPRMPAGLNREARRAWKKKYGEVDG